MDNLNKNQKLKLLKLARKTIAQSLSEVVDSDDLDFSDDIFKEKCGAFVTLHLKGNLRGCIGYISGIKNIPDTITDMSISSAFKDPRFMPLSKDEYNDIDIEISVLSPIEEVKDISSIEVGRDGLIISKGHNSGLLLPQVAVEQGWDRDTFLENTCYKAGLPGNSWEKDGIKIEKFSALVFGEKELGII